MSCHAPCNAAPHASCRLSWGSAAGDLFTLNGIEEPMGLSETGLD
jgi:hypothetical protein